MTGWDAEWVHHRLDEIEALVSRDEYPKRQVGELVNLVEDAVAIARKIEEERARLATSVQHRTLPGLVTALLAEADAWGWDGSGFANLIPKRWADRLRAALQEEPC